MTTPASYSKARPSDGIGSDGLANRTYVTKTSFAAIQFNKAGKGRFVYLPEGVMLRVGGPSRLSGCVEIRFDKHAYHVFRTDLLYRSSLIYAPIKAKASVMAACA
jgi:hypothetical protein